MEDKPLTHEESMKLITNMIGNAKNYYYESGMGALLWGFTNVICFTLAYLFSEEYIPYVFNPFYLMIITAVLQFYFGRKEVRSRKVKNYIQDATRYVWITFGICVLIITIAGGIADIGYIVLPILLLLFGMPTFITGCIYKFRPLIFGGIICWILCIVSLFYKSNFTHLLVAAGALFAWVIPGFVLKMKYRHNNGI